MDFTYETYKSLVKTTPKEHIEDPIATVLL